MRKKSKIIKNICTANIINVTDTTNEIITCGGGAPLNRKMTVVEKNGLFSF
jgi:hypothetical protein